MSGSCPKLELRVAFRREAHQDVRISVVHVQISDHLSMTSVQTFG